MPAGGGYSQQHSRMATWDDDDAEHASARHQPQEHNDDGSAGLLSYHESPVHRAAQQPFKDQDASLYTLPLNPGTPPSRMDTTAFVVHANGQDIGDGSRVAMAASATGAHGGCLRSCDSSVHHRSLSGHHHPHMHQMGSPFVLDDRSQHAQSSAATGTRRAARGNFQNIASPVAHNAIATPPASSIRLPPLPPFRFLNADGSELRHPSSATVSVAEALAGHFRTRGMWSGRDIMEAVERYLNAPLRSNTAAGRHTEGGDRDDAATSAGDNNTRTGGAASLLASAAGFSPNVAAECAAASGFVRSPSAPTLNLAERSATPSAVQVASPSALTPRGNRRRPAPSTTSAPLPAPAPVKVLSLLDAVSGEPLPVWNGTACCVPTGAGAAFIIVSCPVAAHALMGHGSVNSRGSSGVLMTSMTTVREAVTRLPQRKCPSHHPRLHDALRQNVTQLLRAAGRNVTEDGDDASTDFYGDENGCEQGTTHVPPLVPAIAMSAAVVSALPQLRAAMQTVREELGERHLYQPLPELPPAPVANPLNAQRRTAAKITVDNRDHVAAPSASTAETPIAPSYLQPTNATPQQQVLPATVPHHALSPPPPTAITVTPPTTTGTAAAFCGKPAPLSVPHVSSDAAELLFADGRGNGNNIQPPALEASAHASTAAASAAVRQLMSMGFERSRADTALFLGRGDVAAACAVLTEEPWRVEDYWAAHRAYPAAASPKKDANGNPIASSEDAASSWGWHSYGQDEEVAAAAAAFHGTAPSAAAVDGFAWISLLADFVRGSCQRHAACPSLDAALAQGVVTPELVVESAIQMMLDPMGFHDVRLVGTRAHRILLYECARYFAEAPPVA